MQQIGDQYQIESRVERGSQHVPLPHRDTVRQPSLFDLPSRDRHGLIDQQHMNIGMTLRQSNAVGPGPAAYIQQAPSSTRQPDPVERERRQHITTLVHR